MLRWSDLTNIENYALISGITKIHFSEMIGKPYLISFYFSFFISLQIGPLLLVPCIITQTQTLVQQSTSWESKIF